MDEKSRRGWVEMLDEGAGDAGVFAETRFGGLFWIDPLGSAFSAVYERYDSATDTLVTVYRSAHVFRAVVFRKGLTMQPSIPQWVEAFVGSDCYDRIEAIGRGETFVAASKRQLLA